MANDEFTPAEAAFIETMWRPVVTQPPPLGKFIFVVVEYDDVPRSAPTIRVAYCVDGHWATACGKMKGNATHWMPLFSPPAGVTSWVDEYKAERAASG